MNLHNVSFFGQSTALFINSQSQEELHTWFRMIKKRGDKWEKPSQNEGIVVTISLTELGNILEVLEHNTEEWKTVHDFKGNKTSISVKWADKHTTLWINIGDYGKKISGGEIRFLYKLLLHFFDEKIQYATHGKRQEEGND